VPKEAIPMDRRLCRGAGLALGGVLAISPLGAAAQPPQSSQPASPLEGRAWVLESLTGQRTLRPPAPTLRVEAGRVSGSDGCNRYGAPVRVAGSSFRVGAPGLTTRMACQEDLMRQADTFQAALAEARRYRLRGGRLELLAAGGIPVARFLPQRQDLAGSLWLVTGLNNGRQAVVSPLAGTTLSLELDSRQHLVGSAGCNRYRASVRLGQGTLRIATPVATTRKLCSRPDGVMEQERQFLQALESADGWQVEGERLELRRRDGALALSLRRAGGA
jgi:heat shock protein HslJ